VTSLFRRRLLLPILSIFTIIGPAFITANVDNDAPGIATYSVAGAHYGYTLLWLLWPTLVVLLVVQEISARMGVASGKGLADLIREEFGVKVTLLLMLALLVTNFANTAGEFAGLAAGARIFGVSPYLSVPVGAFLVWLLVLRGTYRVVERIFLAASFVYLAYPISGFLSHPDWAEIGRASVTLSLRSDPVYLYTAVGIVGTTIAPWMQFFLQSTVVERGTPPSRYHQARADVIIGSIFAIIVVFFIMVAAAATIHREGLTIHTAAEAARALAPFGRYASTLFAVGLLNAALFAASILPLSTAYSICEGIGWEHGLDRPFRQAPQFYSLYTALIVLGGALVLIPGIPLLHVMILSQVMNGLLLPAILILMVKLVTSRRLMGPLAASRGYTIFAWALAVLLIALDLLLLGATIRGG
jgi:Mn2+/Fe2+ NRAMP family transporter